MSWRNPFVLALLAMASAGALAQTPLFQDLHQMLPADLDTTQAVALGDVDGDGDLDVLIGNQSVGQQNRLYLNDGNGVFTDATTTSLPPDSDKTAAVALGDVDGDGDLDALIGNRQILISYWGSYVGGQNRLYLNDGSGVFTDATATNFPVHHDHTHAVALDDLDGDGDLDALVGNAGVGPQQNRLFLNDGTGIFTDAPATSLPLDWEATYSLALGDVDGDGDSDALIGNVALNRLYLNDGTGVFTDATATNLPPDTDPTVALAFGDVDGDGDLDALIGNSPVPYSPSPGQDRLYLNNGAGVFSDATTTNLPLDFDGTTALSLEDVDGDLDLDLLIGNGGQNRLYLNDGTGAYVDVTSTSLPAGGASALAAGDVDGDGDVDALLACYGRQNLLQLNDGSGVFTGATAATGLPPDYSDATSSLAFGDVDGDGDMDALIGNDWGQQNRLHLNDGTGFFTDSTATNLPPDSDNTHALALGDVDGDGDMDALVGNDWGQQNRLHLNDGTGVFTDSTATNLPPDSDNTHALVLGDVDGDGDLDALIGNEGQNCLYLNNGGGVFTDATATNLPPDSDLTYALVLGDVDGDGDFDILVGNGPLCEVVLVPACYPGGQDRLYLNDGTGVFTDATATCLPPDGDWAGAVALGDVDGDGDLDALLGNRPDWLGVGGQNRLYLNDGTGVFSDVTSATLPVDFDATLALALEDLDEDGDLDALVGNEGQVRFYVNDGTGTFTDASAGNLPVYNASALAVGDVDGDGDLDALIGRWVSQNRLFTNVSRQLAWRGLPRFGKPLIVDMYGPAGEPWVLAASTGTASIPLPPAGTLLLDLNGLVLLGSGFLDAQGRSSVTYAVPPNPGGAAGTTIFGQAAVGLSPRLTNLERFTFTDL